MPREVTALRTPPREADRASNIRTRARARAYATHTHARIVRREGGEEAKQRTMGERAREERERNERENTPTRGRVTREK